jgi:acetolactate synthase regulatory subunit
MFNNSQEMMKILLRICGILDHRKIQMFGIPLQTRIDQERIQIKFKNQSNRITTKIHFNLLQSIKMGKNVTITNHGLQMQIRIPENRNLSQMKGKNLLIMPIQMVMVRIQIS